MKNSKLFTVFLLIIIFALFNTEVFCQLDFAPAERIINQIQKTSFPADTFQITNFGARENEVSDNRVPIMNAIEACSQKGGGVVLIPKGTFFCKGSVSLKSNVNLHLSSGATLLFSPDPKDYLPAVLTRWEGIDIYNYSPMIYTEGQENIAITGLGTINGNAEKIWVPFRKLQTDAQNRARQMNDDQIPVAERKFGTGDYLRSSFIQFINCRRILVEGVTISSSPLWILHPVYCSDLIIRNVNIKSLVINNDGIDFDSCENGLVEGCTFRTGDDAVVFKSGRDRDGWKVNKPTKNIVVRNCSAPQVLHGIAFGSEMSGGIESVYVENFKLGKVEGEAIQFKSNKDRGAFIRDVFIRNVEVDSVGGHLLYFTNGYHSYRGGNVPSEFYNIYLENINCNFANYAIQLQGLEEAPIHDITINNVTVKKANKIFDKKEFFRDVSLSKTHANGLNINIIDNPCYN
ncbi:MAG TPA: glycoside hydrolase family 28 protein [Bacteroidales bacterium]